MKNIQLLSGIALVALAFTSCKDEKQEKAQKTIDSYVAYVDSVKNVKADDLKADWIARALEDEKRFAEEQAMRMPSFVKAAIQAVEEKLKIKKQASKKIPRKESSGAIGPKVVLMASAAPPVKPQTGENGEKMTAKAQKEEKLKAFSEWVSKFHPGLLRSVSLEVKKKEKKGQFLFLFLFLFLFCFVLFCFFVFVFVFFFFFFQH